MPISEDIAKNLEVGVDLVRIELEDDPTTGGKAYFVNTYRLQKLSIKMNSQEIEEKISSKRDELSELETLHSEMVKYEPKPEEVEEDTKEDEKNSKDEEVEEKEIK